MKLTDGTLYIPRVLVRRLHMIAEEVSHLNGQEFDEHDLARQILEEFVRVRLAEANQVIARRMAGEREREERRDPVNLDIQPPKRTFMYHDYQSNVHGRVPIPDFDYDWSEREQAPPYYEQRPRYPQYSQGYPQRGQW